jgi:hypothetical protein
MTVFLRPVARAVQYVVARVDLLFADGHAAVAAEAFLVDVVAAEVLIFLARLGRGSLGRRLGGRSAGVDAASGEECEQEGFGQHTDPLAQRGADTRKFGTRLHPRAIRSMSHAGARQPTAARIARILCRDTLPHCAVIALMPTRPTHQSLSSIVIRWPNARMSGMPRLHPSRPRPLPALRRDHRCLDGNAPA